MIAELGLEEENVNGKLQKKREILRQTSENEKILGKTKSRGEENIKKDKLEKKENIKKVKQQKRGKY